MRFLLTRSNTGLGRGVRSPLVMVWVVWSRLMGTAKEAQDTMPNTKSAAKRLRTDVQKRQRNRIRKSQIKTGERHLMAAIAANDISSAQKCLGVCFSRLDKAAKVGVIHKNKASRKKQRLALRIASLGDGQ